MEKVEIILHAPKEVVEMAIGIGAIVKAAKEIVKNGLKADDIPAFMALLADPKLKSAIAGADAIPAEFKEDTLGSALGLGLALLQELAKA